MIHSDVNFKNHALIGIDLGGTKIQVARILGNELISQSREEYNSLGSADEVLNTLIVAIKKQLTSEVKAIGLGVPSVLDPKQGIIYEAINIPSWHEIHLKNELQSIFDLPVQINNDVNCFALGEYHFGNWSDVDNMACISLGTGMGVGLIINGQLYSGHSCGAGELGELPYKDSKLEDYCSGKFFLRQLKKKGSEIFIQAQEGEESAISAYKEFGQHLAQALYTILLAYNPQIVLFGGSVSNAFTLFSPSINLAMKDFPFQSMWRSTKLLKSQNPNSAVLGAAALCY